jgi:hypothetical protein
MSEIQSIAQGTYTLGQTSATTYQAGPGISITQPSGGTVRISNDETVLWEGTCKANSSVNLSESYKNFEKIKIYGYHPGGAAMTKEVRMSDITSTTYKEITLESWVSWGNASNYKFSISMPCDFTSDTVLATRAGRFVGNWDNSWKASTGDDPNNTTLTQVVGIHRISGGN